MYRRFLASVLGAFVLILASGTASALADAPPAVQSATQSAASGQQAGAASGTTQTQPSNTNVSVRVLSPGNDGSVTQTNSAASDATALNANSTTQGLGQTQGGPGIQTGSQSASNAQLAAVESTAAQYAPSNTNYPVRVLSPGDNGSVTQTNTASSTAGSANLNGTSQTADQSQAGSPSCGCATGIQTSDQSAASQQAAGAASQAVQDQPTNENISVRVLSPGDDGKVTQSNAVSSTAAAVNGNSADQDVTQDPPDGAGVQSAQQDAGNEQTAGALSDATQTGAKNVNVDVRVLSPGNDGSVSQANTVSSTAVAANANATKQTADQSQGGGAGCACGQGDPIQVSQQSNESGQTALSGSEAVQQGAQNTNLPVRVDSHGNDGSVEQSNDASSKAGAANLNGTSQEVDQSTGGGAPGAGAVQTATQEAANEQLAGAASGVLQAGASNSNGPLRVGSGGGGGSVDQSNSAASTGVAGNANGTLQGVDQDPTAPLSRTCGCASSTGIQTSDQQAYNGQAAFALSGTAQLGASNSNSPTRVDSKGDEGRVEQSNDASSAALAGNLNGTAQGVDQDLAGAVPGSTDIQVAGQETDSEQLAAAGSATLQIGASNADSPTRVSSPGRGGSVDQSNNAASIAAAGNANLTGQLVDQDPTGSYCGCGSIGIQAAGQQAENEQGAKADSLTVQDFGRSECGCGSAGGNSNTPTRVSSDGNDGSVEQSNDADSIAAAGNLNLTGQIATQSQSAGVGIGIQALGQSASNSQWAGAGSATFQLGASNANSPTRVYSSGNGGSLRQQNHAGSTALAGNANGTLQYADQSTHGSGGCGCGGVNVQQLGQYASNRQSALGLSKTIQLKPKNANGGASVWSYGNDASVTQSNRAASTARALNLARLEQFAVQTL
jgi:hypothetical protein